MIRRQSSTRQRMLEAWTVDVVRPAVEARGARKALSSLGARIVCLPGIRLLGPESTALAARSLSNALGCARCVFTSRAAVRFALRLQPLCEYSGVAIGLGQGTASALRRAGARRVVAPNQAQNSEAVLALEILVEDTSAVGLVSAPGGRSVLEPELQRRGMAVKRADVYRRAPARLDRRHFGAVLACTPPLAILVSSAEALDNLLRALPAAPSQILRCALAVVASDRLAAHVSTQLSLRCIVARSPRLDALIAALVDHVKSLTMG